MGQIPHELDDEFPAEAEAIRRLASEDAQFAALAERYHLVNGEIYRIEVGEDPASDIRWEDLKKERLRLKDTIVTQLNSAKA